MRPRRPSGGDATPGASPKNGRGAGGGRGGNSGGGGFFKKKKKKSRRKQRSLLNTTSTATQQTNAISRMRLITIVTPQLTKRNYRSQTTMSTTGSTQTFTAS